MPDQQNVVIRTNGSTMGTTIEINGVPMSNVTGVAFGHAVGGLATVTVTLLPKMVVIEGPMVVQEQEDASVAEALALARRGMGRTPA